MRSHLRHVDEPHGQGLIAQDGPVLVTLSPLQHDLQLVGISLQEMRVLPGTKQSRAQLVREGSSVGSSPAGGRTTILCFPGSPPYEGVTGITGSPLYEGVMGAEGSIWFLPAPGFHSAVRGPHMF